MALDWQDRPGMSGYIEDGKAEFRARRGAATCSCLRGALVDLREDEPLCLRCGKATRTSGKQAPGVGRAAA